MTNYVYGLFVFVFAVLYTGTLVWAYRDAMARSKNALLATLLVGLGAWPWGLVLWTAVRPELPSAKKETPSKKSAVGTGLGKYISDVKEMPLLLVLFFLATVYSLVTKAVDLVRMRPIVFQYFYTGFPHNASVLWYVYNLLFPFVTLIVYFRRSYSVLKMYVLVSLGFIMFGVFNSVNFVVRLPAEKRGTSIALYAFTYICALLSLVYQLNQRKYFNRA